MGNGIRISRKKKKKEIPRIIESCFTYFMILSPYLFTLVFYFFDVGAFDPGIIIILCTNKRSCALFFSTQLRIILLVFCFHNQHSLPFEQNFLHSFRECYPYIWCLFDVFFVGYLSGCTPSLYDFDPQTSTRNDK